MRLLVKTNVLTKGVKQPPRPDGGFCWKSELRSAAFNLGVASSFLSSVDSVVGRVETLSTKKDVPQWRFSLSIWKNA